MARTIYFSDGSHEALFCDEYDIEKNAIALERILRERLGDDTAAWFKFITSPDTNGKADMESELQCYELSCESYRSCLQEVFDGLGEIAAMLAEDKRLNRKKIDAVLCTLMTAINNEINNGL